MGPTSQLPMKKQKTVAEGDVTYNKGRHGVVGGGFLIQALVDNKTPVNYRPHRDSNQEPSVCWSCTPSGPHQTLTSVGNQVFDLWGKSRVPTW